MPSCLSPTLLDPGVPLEGQDKGGMPGVHLARVQSVLSTQIKEEMLLSTPSSGDSRAIPPRAGTLGRDVLSWAHQRCCGCLGYLGWLCTKAPLCSGSRGEK